MKYQKAKGRLPTVQLITLDEDYNSSAGIGGGNSAPQGEGLDFAVWPLAVPASPWGTRNRFLGGKGSPRDKTVAGRLEKNHT